MPASRGHNRGGFSTVLALYFVALFAVLAISFAAMSNMNVQMAASHADVNQAQAAAESGLAYGQWLVGAFLADERPAEPETFFDSLATYASERLSGSVALGGQPVIPALPFDDAGATGWQLQLTSVALDTQEQASFKVCIKRYDEQPGLLRVMSTGMSSEVNRTVQLDYSLQRGRSGLFDYAVYGRESVQLHSGVTVNGYNFADPEAVLKIGCSATTSGAVGVHADARVLGDVEVAPGADPDVVVELGRGAEITGEAYAAEEAWEPPAVEPPAALVEAAHGSLRDSATLSASAAYEEIYLGRRDVLMIDGAVDLYVGGSVRMDREARIEINAANPDARLTLYVDGDFDAANTAMLNNSTQDPSRMMIVGLENCRNFDLNNSGDVYGVIYAPEAAVEFHHLVEVHGAVVGRTFDQNEAAEFYYDASLQEATIGGARTPFEVTPLGNTYVEL